jgi:hypothetical protein
MKRASRPYTTAELSKSLNRQLNMYTLAATMGGVSALALAQPAEARIVYTPAHISIPLNGGLVQIDLNKDGVNDFALSNYSYQTHGLGDLFLKVVEDQSTNEIVDANSKGRVCRQPCPKVRRLDPRAGSIRIQPRVCTCGSWGWAGARVRGRVLDRGSG